MKYLALTMLLASCTAAEKVAMRDCAKTVFPPQAVAVAQGAVAACGTDQDCIEREAASRAVSALAVFDTCVDGKLDAGK